MFFWLVNSYTSVILKCLTSFCITNPLFCIFDYFLLNNSRIFLQCQYFQLFFCIGSSVFFVKSDCSIIHYSFPCLYTHVCFSNTKTLSSLLVHQLGCSLYGQSAYCIIMSSIVNSCVYLYHSNFYNLIFVEHLRISF